MIPCSYWASTCIAALPSCMTLYEISVRQTRDLPVVSLFPHPASFRFHLTMDTLAFGYILPTTGWIRDFNPLETCAAGRTTKMQFCISYIQNCISSIIKFITDILPADRSNFHPLTNLLQISQPYGYHHTSPKNQILHSCSVLSSSHSQG